MQEGETAIGEVVTYRDQVGVEHKGLVTSVHGPACINVVYVSSDETKTDSYGRQIERDSSVQLKSELTAHGRYYTV